MKGYLCHEVQQTRTPVTCFNILSGIFLEEMKKIHQASWSQVTVATTKLGSSHVGKDTLPLDATHILIQSVSTINNTISGYNYLHSSVQILPMLETQEL